jgi:hypothetical protein
MSKEISNNTESVKKLIRQIWIAAGATPSGAVKAARVQGNAIDKAVLCETLGDLLVGAGGTSLVKSQLKQLQKLASPAILSMFVKAIVHWKSGLDANLEADLKKAVKALLDARMHSAKIAHDLNQPKARVRVLSQAQLDALPSLPSPDGNKHELAFPARLVRVDADSKRHQVGLLVFARGIFCVIFANGDTAVLNSASALADHLDVDNADLLVLVHGKALMSKSDIANDRVACDCLVPLKAMMDSDAYDNVLTDAEALTIIDKADEEEVDLIIMDEEPAPAAGAPAPAAIAAAENGGDEYGDGYNSVYDGDDGKDSVPGEDALLDEPLNINDQAGAPIEPLASRNESAKACALELRLPLISLDQLCAVESRFNRSRDAVLVDLNTRPITFPTDVFFRDPKDLVQVGCVIHVQRNPDTSVLEFFVVYAGGDANVVTSSEALAEGVNGEPAPLETLLLVRGDALDGLVLFDAISSEHHYRNELTEEQARGVVARCRAAAAAAAADEALALADEPAADEAAADEPLLLAVEPPAGEPLLLAVEPLALAVEPAAGEPPALTTTTIDDISSHDFGYETPLAHSHASEGGDAALCDKRLPLTTATDGGGARNDASAVVAPESDRIDAFDNSAHNPLTVSSPKRKLHELPVDDQRSAAASALTNLNPMSLGSVSRSISDINMLDDIAISDNGDGAASDDDASDASDDDASVNPRKKARKVGDSSDDASFDGSSDDEEDDASEEVSRDVDTLPVDETAVIANVMACAENDKRLYNGLERAADYNEAGSPRLTMYCKKAIDLLLRQQHITPEDCRKADALPQREFATEKAGDMSELRAARMCATASNTLSGYINAFLKGTPVANDPAVSKWPPAEGIREIAFGVLSPLLALLDQHEASSPAVVAH